MKMKLQCQIEIINRVHSTLNIKANSKHLRSTLALGKEPKNEKEFFILHFSTTNKTGTKYKVKNIKQVFAKFMNEGKVTLRFEVPPHDLCIKSEAIQLKSFMKLLKSCITGETKDLKLSNLSSISVTSKDIAPTKLTITNRFEFPAKGFPRTLQSLYINGLKLCNFRRDILLLNQLTVLDLSNNEIEKIPPEFGRLPSLCELYLSNNSLGLTKNPNWEWLLGIQVSKKLKLLDLSGNKLEDLPKSIWKLQNLITLKLDKNNLMHLPSSLGRITTLRYLSVSQNNLVTVPYSLIRCGLDYLDVSSNNFTSDEMCHRNCKRGRFQNSLLHSAAKIVLQNKFFYAPNIIPKTLVEFLDNTDMCACGKPVIDDHFYFIRKIAYNDFNLSRNITFNVANESLSVHCFFCSVRCMDIYNYSPALNLFPL